MSRVAVLGMAPLPFETAPRHHAPGIRSWQLARPLLRAGHRVRLLLCCYPEAYPAARPPREDLSLPEGDGSAVLFTPEAFDGAELAAALDEEPCDLVVGASARPSARAAEVAGERPLWVDMFGHTMAEAQAKAVLHGDDGLLLPYFQTELRLLLRGDAFSTVSVAQAHAVIGELGLVGRLNAATAQGLAVHTIPCAAPDPEPRRDGPAVLRGTSVPADAFLVLWSGGYNTWADVPTLAEGLARAMAARPDLHFASTGGPLAGQDEETYGKLQALVAASRHGARFHLLGWVEPGAVARLHHEADAGLCVDRDIPESRLGSRNRIPVMLSYGLAVASSRTSEASLYLDASGLGRTFPAGDAAALAEALLAFGRDLPAWRSRRREVAARVLTDLSFEATAAPLVAFAAAPRRAADAGRDNDLAQRWRGTLGGLDAKDREIAALRRRILDAEHHVGNLEALVSDKDRALAALRAFEERVKASLAYRTYRKLKGDP